MLSIIRNFFTPVEVTPERWAELHKDKMSPDQLIAATIISKFAADFESWVVPMAMDDLDASGSCWGSSDFNKTTTLRSKERNSKGQLQKKIVVNFHFKKTAHYDYGTAYSYVLEKCEVNDVGICIPEARKIMNEYIKLAKHHRAVKKAAEEALARQIENEKKWNLAEHITGFKRDGFGQLKKPLCPHKGCHPDCEDCCLCEDAEDYDG